MQVAVVIPWRGGDRHRERNYRIVSDHLHQLLPDARHLDADDGAVPFSRAGARNYGVRIAEQGGADVVVICDADTLVEAEPLHAAVTAADDGRLHLPYTRYRSLTRAGTNLHLQCGRELLDCEVDHDHLWATGGILVIRPDAWWRAGGMDERHVEWGAEDTSWRHAADTLLGETVRHEGVIHHLWHPPTWGLGTDAWLANMALTRRYEAVRGDEDAMRALIAEHS